ncbi:MAG: DMT family transporter [Pseudomonadota bacterium]
MSGKAERTKPLTGERHAAGPLDHMRRASAVGFVAVALWALLALFTAGAGSVPPFQLSALTFAIGGVLGLATIALREGPGAGRALARALRLPARVWALSVGGLFGYHFCYFTALQNAPPAEASLIAYLWPLLIVLMSGLRPGVRLGAWHVAGAVAGFTGAALLVLDGAGVGMAGRLVAGAGVGHAIALVAALIWSGYSVLLPLAGKAPTDSVAGFCLVVAALSAGAHLTLETTVWPADAWAWAAVIGLGLGPVGAAFYAWDFGCRRGDIQLLGVSAYAAPVLSTVALIAAGIAEAGWQLAAATCLITLGAALAAYGSHRARPKRLT